MGWQYDTINVYASSVEDMLVQIGKLNRYKPEIQKKKIANYRARLDHFESNAKRYDRWRSRHGRILLGGKLYPLIDEARRRLNELEPNRIDLSLDPALKSKPKIDLRLGF